MRDIIAIGVSMVLSLAFILGMFYFFYKGKSVENVDALAKADSTIIYQQSVLMYNDSVIVNKQKELSNQILKTNKKVLSIERRLDTLKTTTDTIYVLVQ